MGQSIFSYLTLFDFAVQVTLVYSGLTLRDKIGILEVK